jgi:uncharacterized protein YjbI with pentapeptide repeats
MANPEHVAKLREGAEAWNTWRKLSSDKPDLSGTEISERSLGDYDLTTCNFSGATLDRVTFPYGSCPECSFKDAIIVHCTFYRADLQNAIFSDAAIAFTMFDACHLDGADFSGAGLVGNTFTHLSLRAVRGLEKAQVHEVSIGIETFFESGGLPESLLRNSGLPEVFIQYAASLAGKAIEYYSCFLSYSSKDDDFARRLYNDLQGRNIRTWFAPEDLKIGDRFRARIDESIRLHDKLVLILSANSVASDWVETEVESALERERKEQRDVLFPIAIDDEGFDSQQPWAADIRRKRQIGNFRNWTQHDDYTRAFEKLVRDLKKSQPPIIMRG